MVIKYRSMFLCSLGMLLLCAAARAQPMIAGSITDSQTHQPLAGITVQAIPSGITAISNQLGHFSFRVQKEMPVSIVFSSIGYAKKTILMEDLKRAGFQVVLVLQTVDPDSL